MVLRTFPDIGWLQQQANNGFAAVWEKSAAHTTRRGWPTVILHTRTKKANRPDIKGPFSIFTNIKGMSTLSVENRRVAVDENVYFLSNQGQHYTLEIENHQPVETLNIHFGPYFADRVLLSVVQPTVGLLEQEFEVPELCTGFFNQLYPRDDNVHRCIRAIQAASNSGLEGTLWYEEQLTFLLEYLLGQRNDIVRLISLLPPVKASTKAEVYKRLTMATDYVYTHYSRDISLGELAGVACISKFHFLRLFRQLFGTTPYRFIAKVRMEKARALLQYSVMPIYEIAGYVGFGTSPAFSRAFYHALGVYPDVYRRQVQRN